MFDPGLLFTHGWFAGPSQSEDSFIDFTVTGGPIYDLSLLMLGAGFTGSGSVSIVETVCLGDLFSDSGCAHGTIVNLTPVDNSTQTQLSAHLTFAPVTEVDVVKDLSVSGGANGTAFVSGLENQFSETPEPGTLGMLALGIVGVMGGLRRKLNL
jgi:PEP-CTERM motif